MMFLNHDDQLYIIYTQVIHLIQLETSIKKKAAKNIEENQKEYFLREQMKVIQAELGNDSESEYEELHRQIVTKNLPKKVLEKLLKELNKFSKAPFGSPESAVLRTYLETCLEIPFEKYIRIDNTYLSPDVVAEMIKNTFSL